MSENIKTKNKLKGNFGEELVYEYLEKEGTRVLARNFKSNFGEIDVIFKDKDEIVFAEIKSRTGIKYGFPAESVTFRKQNHIKMTAKYYLYINNLMNCKIRFDVIEVYLKSDKNIIHQIKNVFW